MGDDAVHAGCAGRRQRALLRAAEPLEGHVDRLYRRDNMVT